MNRKGVRTLFWPSLVRHLARRNWGQKRVLTPFLSCTVVFLVTGCGDGKVQVRGTVLFEGTPVEEGMIAFEPTDGKGPTTGGPIVGGSYDLKDKAASTVGEKIVRIVAVRKTGRKIPAGSPAPPGTMVDEMIQCIPKEFNDHSTMKVQVTAGKANILDFDLKPTLKKQ